MIYLKLVYRLQSGPNLVLKVISRYIFFMIAIYSYKSFLLILCKYYHRNFLLAYLNFSEDYSPESEFNTGALE